MKVIPFMAWRRFGRLFPAGHVGGRRSTGDPLPELGLDFTGGTWLRWPTAIR